MSVEPESMTHPPLLDKHIQIDMFSAAETKRNDEKNDKISCATPPKPIDDPVQDVQYQTPKRLEPVLGKERAIKILKAFGSQQRPVKEFHTNVLKTPTKDTNKPKREKKSLTPMEKAKETISQIEELKKFKDRTIPTYFGENVVIHHIKNAHPAIETKSEPIKSENSDKVSGELVGMKMPVDSLEALKVYNNLDVDRQSDEDGNSDKEENSLYESLSNDLLDACMNKRKLPAAFDLKTKRSKERKRSKRNSRSSERKRKRRTKDRRKKKSRDLSSKRSSRNSSKKRSRRRRDSNRDIEIPSEKGNSQEIQNRDYQFERYTKTLPVVKYSANPHVMRQLLTNGIANKALESKKKKRSSSKSTAEKRKRKRSSDESAEKLKLKESRRSRSRADKSVKKRRKELNASVENLIPKIKKEKLSDNDAPVKVSGNNGDEKSPNSEEYQSNWDNWDSWEATDEMTGSSMENLLPLGTIPLQLNVPKQDRTALFISDGSTKLTEHINKTTPRMNRCDPDVETPIIVVAAAKCMQTPVENLENGKLNSPLACIAVKSENTLENDIRKISPKESTKSRNEQSKSNHQPIAQLYDEYEQFIMSCMPATDENSQSNGDKSSVTSSLYDGTVTSNDGDEELQALKVSLEKKLHEIEHTDSEDATKVKVPDQSMQSVEMVLSPKPSPIITKESSDSSSSSSSSSSSDSSSSSTSSPTAKKQRRKKSRKEDVKPAMTLNMDDNILNLKTGIEDDELSDDELLSKVELLKQQFLEKRKALADKRKLAANDSGSAESTPKSDALLLSAEKRSAISLKIGGNKTNSIMKPVMLDDDDFTEKLLLEVTPNSFARSKETNKLLIERVIEPGVGLVSSSNSNSLASEIINTKVTRIGMMPNNPIMSDIFPKCNKSTPIEHAVVKLTLNKSVPIDTTEMKNYLNSSSTHLDGSNSVSNKTSASVDRNLSCDLAPTTNRKDSKTRPQTPPSRSDKRDSGEFSSKNRPPSPYHRSRTKESSNRHRSPTPPRHRSPRSRKRSSHRSPSPIRRRSRGSPKRSRSPRKSPRRVSPRRLRRSLSPRSRRTVSPIRGRPRTPPMPEKTTNRKWEPPLPAEYTSSTKNVVACDNNAPQPICRLESSHGHSAPWPAEENSAFAQYDYQHIHPLSPKRSLDDRIANSFNNSNQSYDFQQASGPYMNHFQYSTENTSKIPVLNSQENYYFQPHLPPQNLQALPQQPLPPQHVPRLHAPPMHIQHIAPNQLSPQSLSVQHPPPPPQQRTFPNLIEIRQSNVDVERTPFVVKGNVLEIVPKAESIVAEPIDQAAVNQEDESYYDVKHEVKIELTEEEIERREIKKAELRLKRKQERDKRHLERFMRKEKLKLEIKHLMEVGVHTADIKKATYNPNAVGGKSILRMNASSTNKKSVLFADGVAPGDGTSTSGGEDVAPMLRDRNKRMTKKKLDSKRRRARREASVIKKEVAPQVLEITPFIDPELENMPPPSPPDGTPPARLAQPKLKSTPKLIYFHYDPRSNAMYVSPFPTEVNIPSNPSNDSSPTASSTPDLIQKPKVCFIQPPVFEQQPPKVQGATPTQSLPTANANASILSNSIGTPEQPTPPVPMKSFNQQHQQQPSPNSLPTSPAVYPARQTHSLSPQNFRGPVPINNQQPVPPMPLPPPMQLQAPPMAAQWEKPGFQTNAQVPPLQQPPCAQSWEPDVYPHSQPPVRPHTRFSNANNIVQPRPMHNHWDQHRHPNPQFKNQVHSPQQQPQPPAFHPRSNHPRFHQNQPINVNAAPHQPHNNFAFNANYNYNANSNQSWNNQYRNNH